MEDLNKISSTRVGDNIHFYVNGQEDKGVVVKMDTGYVTVLKDNGDFQAIHINDTFFIKDILVNKSWNDMTMEERTVKLHEIKAYSPRFLAKSWQELPKELKDVMLEKTDDRVKIIEANKPSPLDSEKDGFLSETDTPASKELRQHWRDTRTKSNVEQGHLGSAGRASHAPETNMDIDATEDYEGQTEDEKKEQFKHEDKKPQTTDKSTRAARGGNMNSGTTLRPSDIEDLKNLDGSNNTQATPTSETKYFGANGKQITREEHEKTKTYGSMQEQIWEDWLNKETMSGGDSSPAQTAITTGTTGVYNAIYGKDGRIKGQEKDKEEETEKDKEDKEKERKG